VRSQDSSLNASRPPLGQDWQRFVGSRNLYVTSTAGVVDFLSEIIGVGPFERVLGESIALDLGGFRCRVLSLSALLACKRALGRPKDSGSSPNSGRGGDFRAGFARSSLA
jgi:hypothetical protein